MYINIAILIYSSNIQVNYSLNKTIQILLQIAIINSVFTPTDSPQSVRNLCLVEFFGGVLCCHFALMNFPLAYGPLS